MIARWLPYRRLVMVGDGGFASLAVFQRLRDKAVCVARCRMDRASSTPRRRARPARRGGLASSAPVN